MQNNKLVMGILAHVDAGKTTLAEGLLYTCGNIRTLGRVDHKDAFLDNFALERERGITIFSKQAQLVWEDTSIALLDTPGHVDFSAEMERTLQVLDYAILVISGADGIQGHVHTLWRLLKRYEIPVFLFINKMDQEGNDKDKLLEQLQARLDERCVCFGEENDEFYDSLAMCSETLMEEYLESGALLPETIAEAIAMRQVFPCYFGSALKLMGVDTLLQGIHRYAQYPDYPGEFGARVFKIARDASGNRLTYLKVTGGELRVKMPVSNANSAEEAEIWQEKADQLRIYSGNQFQAADKVEAGGICAVLGLTKTFAGQGLGYEEENALPVLEPVLTYQLLLPEGSDAIRVLGQLRQLEEEEPQLHIVWMEESGEIHVQVMGEVQIEILKSLIAERFGLEIGFGSGSIVYKETIAEPVEGIGHFEPLRHYAEVHLLLEPGERGSGMQFGSVCSEDILEKNWQRLVLTHLEEKAHVGVLTGSEITDMRILLIAGRAHLKHTEGGDFRQATYRAVRQGLRRSQSILLEPVFGFTLELPTENLGRAMSDIQRMHGSFDTPVTEGDTSILTGSAPVATMRDYQREVNAYTRGHGRLSCVLKGYEPCHNAREVIEQSQYDPEADLANPTGSVFCAHGAGFVVNWDEVPDYAHVESGWRPEGALAEDDWATDSNAISAIQVHGAGKNSASNSERGYITTEEIDEIFRQTYGRPQEDTNRYRRYHRGSRRVESGGKSAASDTVYTRPVSRQEKKEEYLLVDGYNIIFAWEELRELARINIDSARDKLMDILCNYQGYLGATLILVFDAYKVPGNPGSVLRYHNIHVVYTKEAETADQYIEKTVHEIGRKYHVTVATSDALEQMIIWGSGALRLSAQGLKDAVEAAEKAIREEYLGE
ncbi:MAG: GTP-binding protein [Lachnospiraceae bacterium]|nr:GTP-binding protein [Lachnospiraceae bacterium]